MTDVGNQPELVVIGHLYYVNIVVVEAILAVKRYPNQFACQSVDTIIEYSRPAHIPTFE